MTFWEHSVYGYHLQLIFLLRVPVNSGYRYPFLQGSGITKSLVTLHTNGKCPRYSQKGAVKLRHKMPLLRAEPESRASSRDSAGALTITLRGATPWMGLY